MHIPSRHLPECMLQITVVYPTDMFFTLQSRFSKYLLLSKCSLAFTLAALFLIYLVMRFLEEYGLSIQCFQSYLSSVELKENGRLPLKPSVKPHKTFSELAGEEEIC